MTGSDFCEAILGSILERICLRISGGTFERTNGSISVNIPGKTGEKLSIKRNFVENPWKYFCSNI